MRLFCSLLLAILLPVAAAASSLSFNFTATLESQTVYSRGSASEVDAPPLTGAFSDLPVGTSLDGVAHLSYEAQSVRGPLPTMWRVRGSCSVGGVDCGFGGETLFNDPTGAQTFFETGEGQFTMTNYWDGTRFDLGPNGGQMVYGGTASDSFSPYEAVFSLSDIVFNEAVETKIAAVPLPASSVMLLTGLLGLAVWRRRMSAGR